jgi:hypothetical protein
VDVKQDDVSDIIVTGKEMGIEQGWPSLRHYPAYESRFILCLFTNIIAVPAALILRNSSTGRLLQLPVRSAARRKQTNGCHVLVWAGLLVNPRTVLRIAAPVAVVVLRHRALDASRFCSERSLFTSHILQVVRRLK